MKIAPINSGLPSYTKNNSINFGYYGSGNVEIELPEFGDDRIRENIKGKKYWLDYDDDNVVKMGQCKQEALGKRLPLDDFLNNLIFRTKFLDSLGSKGRHGTDHKGKIIKAVKENIDSRDEVGAYKNIKKSLKKDYSWSLSASIGYSLPAQLSAMTVALLPHARGYQDELNILKLSDLQAQEVKLKQQQVRQGEILKAKEVISYDVLHLVQASRKNPEIKLPNALMIEHPDKDACNEIATWTMKNVTCNKIALESEPSAPDSLVKNKLKSALEKSREVFEDSGIPTFIHAPDFERLILNSNSEIDRSKMKALLSNTYSKYGATIVFSTQDSKKLDHIAIQPHRMKIIDVVNCEPVSEERIKAVAGEQVKIEKIPYGKQMEYAPNKKVRLYHGNMGYNSSILWAEPTGEENLKAVLKNLALIKQEEEFRNIQTLQIAEFDGIGKFNDATSLDGRRDSAGRRIFEMSV
ncbi:hypothetical protein tpqmel_0555 [Candidatus Gastranaerophilus sp. (ex Termes propinquus)]|nr:hypothetical protein tpqmel_0555 [Candidatus Gastranaerophilus sp. (ex Termes propinquus)]